MASEVVASEVVASEWWRVLVGTCWLRDK